MIMTEYEQCNSECYRMGVSCVSMCAFALINLIVA